MNSAEYWDEIERLAKRAKDVSSSCRINTQTAAHGVIDGHAWTMRTQDSLDVLEHTGAGDADMEIWRDAPSPAQALTVAACEAMLFDVLEWTPKDEE